MKIKFLQKVFSAVLLVGIAPTAKAQWSGTDPIYVTDPDASVAIGTSSPQPYRKLTVKTASNTSGIAVVTKEDDTETGFYVVPDHTNSVVKLYASGGTNKNLALFTGITEAMRISTSGNVGIGNTSPNSLLTVGGAVFINTNTHFPSTSAVKLSVVQDAATADWVTAYKGATTGASFGSLILAGTSSSDLSLLIKNAGNTTDYLAVRGDGNVGVGTANPIRRFVVSDAGAGGFEIDPVTGLNGGTGLLTYDRANNAYKTMSFTASDFQFGTNTTGGVISILNDGKVGIGTSDPQSKLSVNGDIYARKVKVTQTGWPDFVFEKAYSLKPLSEVESYINQHKHLPQVPNAEEVERNNLDLGEMNKILLLKVEEVTLYLIQLEKSNNALSESNRILQATNDDLRKRIEALEKQSR